MAVPTITSVSPSAGHSGGRYLVTIEGTNFQLAPSPPATGVAPEPNPSMEVKFGTTAASKVFVVTATQLFALLPAHVVGAVDVIVSNIDQDGALIGAETATAPSAFAFARINLNTVTVFQRVVRELIISMRKELVDNVALETHTDYDNDVDDGLNIVAIAELPGIALLGPKVVWDGPRGNPGGFSYETSSGEFSRTRHLATVDLEFTMIAATELEVHMLNLQANVVDYFQRNEKLPMLKDPDDSTQGYVEYDMELEDFPATIRVQNEDNVRHFSCVFSVRGVDVEPQDIVVEKTREIETYVPSGATDEEETAHAEVSYEQME